MRHFLRIFIKSFQLKKPLHAVSPMMIITLIFAKTPAIIITAKGETNQKNVILIVTIIFITNYNLIKIF